MAWVASVGHRSGSAAQVALQVVVLLPLALLAIVGAATRLGGRALGAFAGAVWVFLPLVGYHFADFRMRPPLAAGFLSEVYGLAGGTELAAAVALAAAAYLLVATLQDGRRRDAAASGVAAAIALVLSPASMLFLPGAAVALGLRRRAGALGAFAGAAAPGLVLALAWRWGHVPPVLHWNWSQFHLNLMGFREYFWSLRVVEWLPIAGTIALLRRSLPVTIAIGTWFWTTVLLRGSLANTWWTGDPFHPSSVFLVRLLPALPAFVLLVGALPLLVPRLPARLAPFSRPANDRV